MRIWIWCLLLSACSWGPVPVEVGGWGFHANVVIPQHVAHSVPVEETSTVAKPTLLVPMAHPVASEVATVTAPSGNEVEVPVQNADVTQPTLAVPKK